MKTSANGSAAQAAPRRIRLVVSDIDGTLLGPSGVASPRTLSALRRVRERGVSVALATARRLVGCVPAAQALGVEGPLILYDGALVCSYPSGEVITHEAMDREHVADACQALAEGGLRPIVQYFHEDGEHLAAPAWDDHGDPALGYLHLYADQLAVTPFDELHTQRGLPLRVVAFRFPEQVLPAWLEERTAHVGMQLLSGGSYGPDEITYFRRETSKGLQTRRLAERLGIALGETLCIGDGGNDISMLRIAGVGVAMGQADAQVKAAASVETLPFAHDGAALALERYVLGVDASSPRHPQAPRVTDDPDELLDLVDDEDQVVGVVRRGEANRNPALMHRSVEVLVLTSWGTLLLQRRAATKDLYPGMLCASASGHVAAGQTYDAAATQELREELGITASLERVGTVLVRAERETEHTAVYLAWHDGPFTFSPVETDGGLEVPIGQALDPAFRAELGIVPALEAGLALVAARADLRARMVGAGETPL